MGYQTLITAEELAQNYQRDDWVIVDCRFSLTDTELGRRLYEESHIPGAVYAHLDEDLSGPILPGTTSRHPLPSTEEFVQTVSEWGISDGIQVVAYDNLFGAIAARLWWMLRQHGHRDVAVLDGAWAAWIEAGYPVTSEQTEVESRQFIERPVDGRVATTEEILENIEQKKLRLFDVRAPERYRGEEEPLDPVAGHIPGAVSAPYADNLDESGYYLPKDQLATRYERLLSGIAPENAVFYCGSGVTSAHSLLALAHLGIEGPRLYAGSWSQWITDPERPIATGSTP